MLSLFSGCVALVFGGKANAEPSIEAKEYFFEPDVPLVEEVEPEPKTTEEIIEEIGKIRPRKEPENKRFYELVKEIKSYYYREVPSIYENRAWPYFIAFCAEEALQDELSKPYLKRKKKPWKPSASGLNPNGIQLQGAGPVGTISVSRNNSTVWISPYDGRKLNQALSKIPEESIVRRVRKTSRE